MKLRRRSGAASTKRAPGMGSAEKRADEITLEVAGRLLMISAERVRQLIKMGYIERTRRGYTTIPSAVQGYIRFLKESAAENTKSAAANRAQEARADEIEMRNAARRRELVSLDEALEAMSLLVGKVNAEMNGLPRRCTRDVDLQSKIEAEADGAKERIAAALRKLSGYARNGGEAPHSL